MGSPKFQLGTEIANVLESVRIQNALSAEKDQTTLAFWKGFSSRTDGSQPLCFIAAMEGTVHMAALHNGSRSNASMAGPASKSLFRSTWNYFRN
eukprot:186009-Amphidinium_carterae.2